MSSSYINIVRFVSRELRLRAVPERQNEQCYREVEKPSALFLLIRINCLALCILLNIAFRAKFTRMIYVLLCRRFVCHMFQRSSNVL